MTVLAGDLDPCDVRQGNRRAECRPRDERVADESRRSDHRRVALSGGRSGGALRFGVKVVVSDRRVQVDVTVGLERHRQVDAVRSDRVVTRCTDRWLSSNHSSSNNDRETDRCSRCDPCVSAGDHDCTAEVEGLRAGQWAMCARSTVT